MQKDNKIACHECDLLITVPAISDNQSLYCPGCKTKQFTKYKRPLDYSISFALSALIMLVMANSFPFLSFESQGQSRTINILNTPLALFSQGFTLLAVLVFAFIILLPLVYLISVISLLVPIKLGIKPLFPVLLGRLMSYFLPWVMAEVFIVGVLVALIKIIEMADIVLGFSFWAYILFVIFFTLTANIANRHQLWEWIENAKS